MTDFPKAQAAVTQYVNFLISKETPGMPAADRMQINSAIAAANQLGRDLMTAQLIQDQKVLDQLKVAFTNEATLLRQRTQQLKAAFAIAADAAQALAIATAIAAAIAGL